MLSLKKSRFLFPLLIIFNFSINYANPNIRIKVLIDSCETGNANWHLHSQDGFQIKFDQTIQDIDSKNINITLNNNILINNKEYAQSSIKITSKSKYLKFNNNNYGGYFSIVKSNNQIYLINHVKLENYVHCVLSCEGWPGWPEEFNKAMAVVIRTYGLSKLVESKKTNSSRTKLPYDIKNSNLHQTYNGIFLKNNLKKAIEETEGLILSFNKQPILAMFDCCCGGIIPSKISNFDFKKAPYLSRSYPCTYCKDCKIFKWSKTYEIKEIEEQLKQILKPFNRLVDIKIEKKDPAGIVKKIKAKSRSWIDLDINNFKSIFKGLKSQSFSIKKSDKSIIIDGIGYGHQIGLCQWGACKMAKIGWNYKDILKYYYQNINFMKVC